MWHVVWLSARHTILTSFPQALTVLSTTGTRTLAHDSKVRPQLFKLFRNVLISRGSHFHSLRTMPWPRPSNMFQPHRHDLRLRCIVRLVKGSFWYDARPRKQAHAARMQRRRSQEEAPEAVNCLAYMFVFPVCRGRFEERYHSLLMAALLSVHLFVLYLRCGMYCCHSYT